MPLICMTSLYILDIKPLLYMWFTQNKYFLPVKKKKKDPEEIEEAEKKIVYEMGHLNYVWWEERKRTNLVLYECQWGGFCFSLGWMEQSSAESEEVGSLNRVEKSGS